MIDHGPIGPVPVGAPQGHRDRRPRPAPPGARPRDRCLRIHVLAENKVATRLQQGRNKVTTRSQQGKWQPLHASRQNDTLRASLGGAQLCGFCFFDRAVRGHSLCYTTTFRPFLLKIRILKLSFYAPTMVRQRQRLKRIKSISKHSKLRR